jgi:DNA-binding NtrC family response regulator
MANCERELITSILEHNHYNLTKAADQLKISRHALRYRMQRLNISLDAEAEAEQPVAAEKDKP